MKVLTLVLLEPYIIILFQASFRPKYNALKSTKWFVIGAQLIKELHFADNQFLKIDHFFRHLKLEIASAIPASNDEKNRKK